MIAISDQVEASLKAEWKRALYYFEIPEEGIVITSFIPSEVNVTEPTTPLSL
jgi:hypothetical protein